MPTSEPSVTVAGAGIAGLTAALKLAQRGYAVTVYESRPFLGGNASAHKDEKTGIFHDIYPHMFSTFYRHFWTLLEEDLGIRREDAFEPRESVKILRDDGRYLAMTDGASFRKALQNLFGGVLPPADMLVWAYSMLDLMSQPGYRHELLNRESVNGFMRSRPYGTDRAAILHDYVLMVVWSAHSYGVSAAAYRDFFRYTLRNPSPLTWVLKGDLYTHLMLPFRRKLEELGVTIHLGHGVTRIVAGDDGVSEIEIQETRYDPLTHRTWPDPDKEPYTEPVENLVLATSPKAMGTLAQSGGTGQRLVDYVPELSEARQARAEPIAVLDLYFNKRIPDIPADHVSLWDSPMNLSFLDLSQVWEELKGGEVTALTVAASNYYGLPSEARGSGVHQNIVAMVAELRRYLGPLRHEDIDFEKTHFQTNLGDELFINDVGSETWRPRTHHEAIPNLFMAGGYCVNDVGMATVEAAVTSGLLAARALHEQAPLGDPVEIAGHEAWPDSIVHMMKLALMPAAYQAKWWSEVRDMSADAATDTSTATWARDLASLWSLPARYAVDAWETSVAWYGCFWDDLLGRR